MTNVVHEIWTQNIIDKVNKYDWLNIGSMQPAPSDAAPMMEMECISVL